MRTMYSVGTQTLYQIAFSLYHQHTGEGRAERISSYKDDFSTLEHWQLPKRQSISRAVRPGGWAHSNTVEWHFVSTTMEAHQARKTKPSPPYQSRLSHAKSADVCGWLWEECQSREGGGSTGLMNKRLVIDN